MEYVYIGAWKRQPFIAFEFSECALFPHSGTEAGRLARDRALQWGAATLQNLELHCVSLPPPSGLLWYRSWCWVQKKRVFTVLDQSLESSWFTITCHSRSLDCRRMEVLLLKFLLQDIGNDLGLYLIFILLNKIPCLRSECKPYSLITTDMVPGTRMIPVWFIVVSFKPQMSHRLPVSEVEM